MLPLGQYKKIVQKKIQNGTQNNVPKWCLYLSSSVLCDPRSTEKEQNENLFTHTATTF